jgi:NAD(P)-dependent dehydrogenase (short-subunit alcohol dehydrogenase family)/acyl dehydratase
MPLYLDAIGKRIGPVTRQYDWRDVVLYALGVGAGSEDLGYVYERDLKALPTFGALSIYDFMADFVALSGADLAGILHGEHELILYHPIPPLGAELTSEAKITAIYDKGQAKGALVVGHVDTYHPDGFKLYTNIATLFSRLDGGFGGEVGPRESFEFPDRAPDFEELAHPSLDQPLLYRLSGDTFALHVDPAFAHASGFEQPIMHGLCTQGYACRAIVKHLFPGEPERMVRFRNRFSQALYPGEPIKTQIWLQEEGTALFRTVSADNADHIVIDRGVVEWLSREEAEYRAEIGGYRFDGQVAIVTGAGRGLGRVYALELAKRGARVVVNDVGGARDGSGADRTSADGVVEEIVQAGGAAVANYDSVATVEGGERIVGSALEAFGRVDILINNAGILRDKSFAKMTAEMWEGVLDVHLRGAFNVTAPAFRVMKEQGYGRIVMTTSGAGLYGNYGQTNYSAAKLGLVGMVNTLKLEGSRYDIKVNAVAPLAMTRLTEDVLPGDLGERLRPELVAPLVLYLCSSACGDSGLVLEAGAGHFGRAAVLAGAGVHRGSADRGPSIADIHRSWQQIDSLEGAQAFHDAGAALMAMLSKESKS